MQSSQNILVIGATGGSGRAAVEQLLAAGHRVTAFSRSAHKLQGLSDRLQTIDGDATNAADIEAAVPGHDAVIIALGITESPIRVRLFGAAGTATDVRSAGTRTVIAAMRRHGVRRLVALTSYGIGATQGRLRLMDRAIFSLLFKPQIEDTKVQERIVRASGLDWVLVQPVYLTDEDTEGHPFCSREGDVEAWKISRSCVGRFLGETAVSGDYIGESVAISGRSAA